MRTDIGKKIKELREDKGLSQRELARMAGTNNTDIMNIENGKTKYFKVDTLRILAEALNVPTSDLLIAAGYLPEDDPVCRRGGTAAGELAEALAIEWPGIVDMMSAMLQMSDDGVIAIIKYAAYTAHMERIEIEDEQDNDEGKKELNYGAGGDGA